MTMEHVSKYPTTFYRVSLKAIIRNDKGEVLVNKEYDNTTWNLPGGGWDHGETEREAMARELYEEVGYEGDFTMKLIDTSVAWLEEREAYLLWLVYEVETENQDFRVGDDTTAVEFIDPASLSEDSPSHAERWIKKHLG